MQMRLVPGLRPIAHQFRRCLATSSTSSSPAESAKTKVEWKGLLGRELYQGTTVLRLILHDPKRRNSLSLEMLQELHRELKDVARIQKIRSVILAAEGPAFSAGHDLRELQTRENAVQEHRKIFDECAQLMQFIQSMPVPVIAEVNGVAAAAGCQLVASCDIVVASDSSKFMVPGQKVGLFCSTPGIAISRALPRKVALDMLLTGRILSAQEALQAGLVSRVVPADDVRVEALNVAESIGKFSRSVTSLGKAFFYAQVELPQSNAYRAGSAVMTENLRMRDAQEGIAAFVEKRDASFDHSETKVH